MYSIAICSTSTIFTSAKFNFKHTKLCRFSAIVVRKIRGFLVRGRLDGDSTPDLTPADETPVTLHSPGEGDLLPEGGADGGLEADLGQIGFDRDHPAAGGEGADVDHEHLVLRELGDLGALLVALHPHAEKTPEIVKRIEKETELVVLE